MRPTIRRIGDDIRHLRNIDAYAIAMVALVFGFFSAAGDVLPVNARWAVVLIGLSLLVFRMTLPEEYNCSVDDVLKDRTDFEKTSFSSRLRHARELWIFAPSAVNLLTPQTCDAIRSTLLDDSDGVVRIAVLDPRADAAVGIATRQLDESLDLPSQLFPSSLGTTILQLKRMAGWKTKGSFEYRLLDYNPGFSMIVIDPSARHG